MAYISLPNVNVHRKLNAKRLLTFGIIVMLTSVAVIAVRPANASPEPWWFLPSTWLYTTGTGSNRTMLVAAHPLETAIPPLSVINTVGKSNFTVEISAPDSSGNASITVPQESVSIANFYIKTLLVVYLWGHIYATADGSGTLDTKGGNLNVDVYTKVIGNGIGNYTLEREFTNNVTGTSRPGDSLVYLPLEINVYSAVSTTNGTKIEGVDIYEPMPLYVTTGFSKTTIDDSAGPYPSGQSHPSLDGMQMNVTAVPTAPYTGTYTGVTSGGMLDLWAFVLGLIHTYSDSIFTEIMVSEPIPSIPSEPITSVTVSPTIVLQGDPVDIPVTVHNGLAYSATSNITVYANDTAIETKLDETVAAGANKTLTFTWDTTGKPYGTYTIKAELDGKTVIDSKTYTFHDTYIDGTVQVSDKIPGDVNGDDIVDVSDLSLLGKAYRSTPSSPNWDEDCDINGDDAVDVTDLSILGKNYRRSI